MGATGGRKRERVEDICSSRAAHKQRSHTHRAETDAQQYSRPAGPDEREITHISSSSTWSFSISALLWSRCCLFYETRPRKKKRKRCFLPSPCPAMCFFCQEMHHHHHYIKITLGKTCPPVVCGDDTGLIKQSPHDCRPCCAQSPSPLSDDHPQKKIHMSRLR